jgi:hypothetical protein
MMNNKQQCMARPCLCPAMPGDCYAAAAAILVLLLVMLCQTTNLVDIKASREVLARACRSATHKI